MSKSNKRTGRPATQEAKRSKFINIRFTEEEYDLVGKLEKQLGISRTKLIRTRVLADGDYLLINAGDLIRELDGLGTEMGRVGNNINQLARHANTMRLQGNIDPAIVDLFNSHFETYLRLQQKLEISLRKILRQMGKR